MKNLIVVLKVFVMSVATLLISSQGMLVSAQNEAAPTGTGEWEAPPPFYDPYPPGILPADLNSEVARVRREVNSIFKEAIGEWQALPPPKVESNPPTLQGSGYH